MSDAAPVLPRPDRQSDDTAVAVTPLYDSRLSGFVEPVELVVRSPDEWRRAWIGAHPNRAATLPAPPDVDFATALVLVVAAGTQPTGGITVRIDTVRAHPDGSAVVHYTIARPASSCMSIQQVTAPVIAVQIPRPLGAIHFQRHDATTPC